ncbi:MAG: hypothetical protein LBI28_02265 [Treponema sp.]|jgi:hypothetical protein|nr:hypothetical protein [Treponema sp.]
MKRFLAIIILVLASMTLLTCDIGLGHRINMKGPVVTISGPARTVGQNYADVNEVFTLEGTARSVSTVALMTITLDYYNKENFSTVRMGREWKWEGGWKFRESDQDLWKSYTSADYPEKFVGGDDLVPPPSWSLIDDTVYWSLPLLMEQMQTGEYTITVSAWDTAGNYDSNSFQKWKVRFNNKAPNLRIRLPLLKNSLDGSSLSNPTPPDSSVYIFDPFGNPEGTYNSRMHFVSDFKDIAYFIELPEGNYPAPSTPYDEGYKLTLEMSNPHNIGDYTDIGQEKTGKTIYWTWDSSVWESRGLLPQAGAFTAGTIGSSVNFSGLGNYTKVDDSITLLPSVALLPSSTVTPIQFISYVDDTHGNREYNSKGWVFYLPDADKPYAHINFGYKVREGEKPPANATIPTIQRGGIDQSNYAYDDDGVLSVKREVYRVDENYNEILPKTAPNYFLLDTLDGDRTTRFRWPFTALSSFGTGTFKIVVTVTDINGKEGDPYIAYFTILSNSTPTIVSIANDGQILWGDTNGKVTINGIAQVEDHDACTSTTDEGHNVRVDRVTIAWTNPKLASDVENLTRFADQNAPVWETARTGGQVTADGSKVITDTYGNKIWEVASVSGTGSAPSASRINFSGFEGNKNPSSQEEWKFALDLNIFTDLNIGNGAGQNPFDDQLFYVRVLSYNEHGTALSSSPRSFTTRGDNVRPSIQILEIWIEDTTTTSAGIPWEWNLMLPSIASGTKIWLKGSWSDNSMTQWSTIANRHLTRMGGVPVVRWEGELNQFDFVVPNSKFILSTTDGGTWETDRHEFITINEDATVFLTSILQDLAGNPGQAERQITITTNNPTLTRISSSVVDGTYGGSKATYPSEGSTTRYIEIFMDFNQAVTLNRANYPSGTAGDTAFENALIGLRNTLKMKLSNGGEASYQSGAGSTRLSFNYDLFKNPPTNTEENGGDTTGNLNVDDIEGLVQSDWVAVTDGAKVVFMEEAGKLNVLNRNNAMSLARQKNILIDRKAPTVSQITTSSATRPGGYGIGSSIYITVIFNEPIKVTGYPILTLNSGGGVATFQNTVGENSLSFLYNVAAGQNTNALAANVLNLSGGSIADIAGNSLSDETTVTSVSQINAIIVDTTNPLKPEVTGIGAGRYYGQATFVIDGLESNLVTVEYSTDPTSYSWSTYSGNITSSANSKFKTDPIDLPLNGTYRIVARQFDAAETTKNRSDNSDEIAGVIVDRGEILLRLSSANPDGVYSYGVSGKSSIDIDMYFRIPVKISATSPELVLNTNPQKRAVYVNGDNSTKLTFRYVLGEDDYTANGVKLDVTSISWNGGNFSDAEGQNINTWVTLPVTGSSGRFNMQKNITILRGYPDLTNRNMASGIQYSSGNYLQFTFDRDIYRGDTENKFMIMQTETGYRMPIVLTERRFAELFNSRTDIWATNSPFTNAKAITMTIAQWQAIGEALYEKGSNGATAAGAGDVLTSDTTIKYVLKYNINPNNAEAVTVGGTTYTAAQIMIILRAAEAIVYSAKDQGVTIINSGNDPRILRINLNGATTGGTSLPVLGATYEWSLPKGFVKDSLGKPSGGITNPEVPHVVSTTGANATTITYSGIEPPVIRINKGDDSVVDFGTSAGNTRQARQPLQTNVKIESRTPEANIDYTYRSKDDSAGNLIWRNGQNNPPGAWNAANYTRYLPNTGDRSWQSYQNVRMRPQSGVNGMGNFSTVDPSVNWVALGLNFNAAMAANWTTNATTGTASPFNIGSENYLTGGQEFNIRARARVGTGTWSSYAYEAAYRSVFVYNKQTINGNTAGNNVRLNRSDNNNGKVPANILNRIWIRGGDSTSGDPTTPNFPLARDPSKYRKIKLLTPIDAAGLNTDNRQTYSRTNANIVNNISATDYGDYLWIWVTWGINVPAYVDVLYGPLPASTVVTQAPTQTQALFQGWVPCKEHYAVFPGRTTVVETRDGIYNNMWDGQHGNLDIASAVIPPAQSD